MPPAKRPPSPAPVEPRNRPNQWSVPDALERAPLDRALRQLCAGESWGKVRRWIETGKVHLDGRVVTDARQPVRSGQELRLLLSAPRPRGAPKHAIGIAHVDAHVVVVHKPSGISTVPYTEEETGTLDRFTSELLAEREGVRRAPLGIVHRLDKETSGLVLFARTLPAKRALKNQFRFHSVRRRYWALCQGDPGDRTLTSRLVQNRGDGLRGSTDNPKLGRTATTHVRVLKRLSQAALLECRLETGRTHQIRIHLAEAGHPLLGERVYARNSRAPRISAPRVMLHAFELGFEHPVSGKPLCFESSMPDDMTALLRHLED